MQESAEEADAQIQRHFARLRAVLDEREKELRNNLRAWRFVWLCRCVVAAVWLCGCVWLWLWL